MSQKNINFDKNKIIELFNQKKFNKISKISKSILKAHSSDIVVLKIILFSEYNLKNYNDAEQVAQKIIYLNENSENLYIYGNTLKAQNKNFEAIDAFKKAIKLNSKFTEALNNLANTQKKIGQYEEAKDNYLLAIKADNKNFEAYFNFANILRSEKNYKEALTNYKRVTEINENFVDAYNNIGQIYAILGEINEAKKYFKISINKNKLFSEPYKYYVTSTKIEQDDEIFSKLKDVIKNENLTDQQKIDFYYSLSKSYFDLNQNQEAFDYLQKAKKIGIENSNYSFEKEKKNFDKIQNYFSDKETLKPFKTKSYNTYPIFILGMPRSGSSLIEQIISNHSSVHGGGELTLLPLVMRDVNWDNFSNFEQVIISIREKYLAGINSITNEKFITDKMPGNFLSIGFILNAIPEAKILHTKRNPMAVCWSNFKSNFLNNVGMEYTSKQEYIAEYYVLYDRLMKFWKKKYKERIIEIDYEDLVSNHEAIIKIIFKKLELKWENHLFDFYKNKRAVETNSFLQIRSKIYKNSSDEWRKHEKNLKPIINILKNNNIRF